MYNFTYGAFGNAETVKVGNTTLASYTYNDNNGKISTMTYGNGLTVKYLYDDLDRTSEILYNTGSGGAFETVVEYTYDNGGRLYSSKDHKTGDTTYYKYDPSGKLLQTYSATTDTDKIGYTGEFKYNEKGEMISRTDYLGYRYYSSGYVNTYDKTEYAFEYNDDGTLFAMGMGSTGNLGGTIRPTYDNLGMTTQKTYDYVVGSTGVFNAKITYQYWESYGMKTPLVSQYKIERGTSDTTLSSTTYNYTYDSNGNITQITDSNGVIQNQYWYDDLGQLIREDNRALGQTYVWTYDNAGNRTVMEYGEFSTEDNYECWGYYEYEYNNAAWGDQLTSANGWVYTYDEIGNPITKTNTAGTDGYRYVWEGRRLMEIWQCWYTDGELSYDDILISFTYNADGIRTGMTGATTKDFVLDGTRIISETSSRYTMIYLYDETGSPIGIKYRSMLDAASEYELFFFEKNLQGDIVAIYNEAGTKIASYTYDAWGNFTKTQTSGVTYSTADTYIYNNNPFTYRGYYYDSVTGLYYLQTRYYDPSIGRFINADTYVSTGQGFVGNNMYAYCNNNPVVYVDFKGEDAIYITDYEMLPILGHSALLIQDENGIWYFTEYGLDGKDIVRTIMLPPKYQSDPYGYLDDNYSYLRPVFSFWPFNFNKYKVNVERVRLYKSMYIKGDFSKSVELALSYSKTGFGAYDLFSHNCLHYAQNLLKAGNCDSWAMECALYAEDGFIPTNYIGDVARQKRKFEIFMKIISLFGG